MHLLLSADFFANTIRVLKGVDPEQEQLSICPYLYPSSLHLGNHQTPKATASKKKSNIKDLIRCSSSQAVYTYHIVKQQKLSGCYLMWRVTLLSWGGGGKPLL